MLYLAEHFLFLLVSIIPWASTFVKLYTTWLASICKTLFWSSYAMKKFTNPPGWIKPLFKNLQQCIIVPFPILKLIIPDHKTAVEYNKMYWLTCDSFSRDLMHLAASRDHAHSKLIDHQHAPLNLLPCLLLLLYHLIHNLCNISIGQSVIFYKPINVTTFC